MKKINSLTAGLFIFGAVIGSLAIGSGAGAQTTTPLSCFFGLSSVRAGEPAVITATGGNGSYVWSSPGLVITNPTGSNFSVAFNAPGNYPVTVTSAGLTSTCNILVTPASSGTPTPTPAPGMPSTGELAE